MQNTLVIKCCECKRVRTQSGWLQEVDAAQQRHDYTHTYCPACFKHALQSIDDIEDELLKEAG
jgi:ribosomal protein L44E